MINEDSSTLPSDITYRYDTTKIMWFWVCTALNFKPEMHWHWYDDVQAFSLQLRQINWPTFATQKFRCEAGYFVPQWVTIPWWAVGNCLTLRTQVGIYAYENSRPHGNSKHPCKYLFTERGNVQVPLTKPHAASMNHDFKIFRDKNA